MRNLLATLHDSNNRRLRFQMSICSDTFVRLFVFFFRLFELDLVDLDPHLDVREVLVIAEDVGFGDGFRFGSFGKDTVATAGEGLERAGDVGGC